MYVENAEGKKTWMVTNAHVATGASVQVLKLPQIPNPDGTISQPSDQDHQRHLNVAIEAKVNTHRVFMRDYFKVYDEDDQREMKADVLDAERKMEEVRGRNRFFADGIRRFRGIVDFGGSLILGTRGSIGWTWPRPPPRLVRVDLINLSLELVLIGFHSREGRDPRFLRRMEGSGV